MTLSQYQQAKFADYKAVTAALTVADLEASNWTLIQAFENNWMNYIKTDTPPGSDRPKDKPDHP